MSYSLLRKHKRNTVDLSCQILAEDGHEFMVSFKGRLKTLSKVGGYFEGERIGLDIFITYILKIDIIDKMETDDSKLHFISKIRIQNFTPNGFGFTFIHEIEENNKFLNYFCDQLEQDVIINE